MPGSRESGNIPDDVKQQAVKAVGGQANSLPVAPQAEDPPVPVKGLPAQSGNPSDLDAYAEELLAAMRRGDVEPPLADAGPFSAEDVGEGDPITPTPDVDIQPDA